MKKKVMTVILLCLALFACGCGDNGKAEDTVAVQSVAMLTGLGGMGAQDRYSGVVVSQNTHDINKEEDRKVAELKVSAGQTVKKGDVLFTYDQDEMKLAVDTGKLELEKLQNTIDNTKKQIDKLTKEKAKAKDSEQLSYSIEIQTLETDVKESEYQLEVKKAAQEQLEKTLGNADVTSPIDGVVQSINEKGETDDYGNTKAYIVLMETGNYRVKGTINEMNRAALMGMEGETMLIRSRVDSAQTWEGTLEKVDTENPVADTASYEEEEEESSSQSTQYPFYIKLDDSEGLMMGQHVYIEMGDAAEESDGALWLSASFIEQAEDGNAYMWVANDNDKLERRQVTLGEYDEDLEEYEITEGLSTEDYVAIYDISLKEGMPVTRYDEEYFEEAEFDEEESDWEDEGDWEDEEGDEGDEGDWEEADEEDLEEEDIDSPAFAPGADEAGAIGGEIEDEIEGFDDIGAEPADDIENYDDVDAEEER